jgi:hypothetical protein
VSFRTVIVHVDDNLHCKQRLDAAIRVSLDFSASLAGLYVVSAPELTPSVAALLPADVVASHPGVLECGAVGVPDDKTGEAVKVVIVRKDPNLTKEAVLLHCKSRLTAYKQPRHVEFRDTLPKSPIGKVLRRELRDDPKK